MNTFEQDYTLPSLPLPTLSHTCHSLYNALKALSTEDDWSATKQCLDSFQEQATPFQQLLEIEKSELFQNASWLRKYWDDSYLSNRQPNAGNSNYAFSLQLSQLKKNTASVFVLRAFCELALAINKENLEPEQIYETKLSMDMFQQAFYSRIPLKNKDMLRSVSFSFPLSLAVVCNQHWFSVDITDKKGNLASEKELSNTLLHIEKVACSKKEGLPIGAITSMNRESAACLREKLTKDLNNRLLLEQLENALFAICLESTTAQKQENPQQLLFGNSGNRWFDHSLQFILHSDGELGMNLEHAGSDGSIWTYLLSKAEEIIQKRPSIDSTSESILSYKHFQWNINEQIEAQLNQQKTQFATRAETILLQSYNCSTIKKSQFKAFHVSLDAVLQFSFQAAFWQLKHTFPSVYEAVSVRHFYEGRTECLRPVTEDSKQFIQVLSSSEKPTKQGYTLYRTAEASHKIQVKVAKQGLGAERHLFGLQQMYKSYSSNNLLLPALFTNINWVKLSSSTLSTSSLTSSLIQNFIFSPVESDGLGIGYGWADNELQLCVTATKKSSIHPNDFIQLTLQNIEKIYCLLDIFSSNKKR